MGGGYWRREDFARYSAGMGRTVRADGHIVADHDLLFISVQVTEDPHRADDPGSQCGDRRACDAQGDHEDQERVAGDVHQVCEDADPHGELAVTAGPVEAGASLKQREEGIGQHCDPEIGEGRFHDVSGYLAEDQGQERRAE